MSKHTPLPWSEYHGEDTHGWSIFLSPEGHEIGSGDGGWEEEDAKLIVTAVNNHAKLVEALREVLEHLPQTDGWTFKDMAIDEARTLLAQLDGELE